MTHTHRHDSASTLYPWLLWPVHCIPDCPYQYTVSMTALACTLYPWLLFPVHCIPDCSCQYTVSLTALASTLYPWLYLLGQCDDAVNLLSRSTSTLDGTSTTCLCWSRVCCATSMLTSRAWRSVLVGSKWIMHLVYLLHMSQVHVGFLSQVHVGFLHGHRVMDADLFSLRSWRRKLHIWSPDYTSTLALHKLRKWFCFGYTIATSVMRSSFLMRSYFWHGRCVQKVRARLWYARIKSCNSGAGFGADIGSERSRNSLQLGENVWVEEASVWNFFRRRFSVSLQRLCYCDEKEKSSIPEISPSLSWSLSVFGSFEFEVRQRTCSLRHLQIGLSWRSIWL